MADLAWRSAVERASIHAPDGKLADDGGLRVRIVDVAQLVIASHPDPDIGTRSRTFGSVVAAVTGQALALTPNTRSGNDDTYTVWLDPARWLVVGSMTHRWPRLHQLRSALSEVSPETHVSDASDALVVIDIAGERMSALMAMACAFDVEAAAFAPPRTARTAFAGVSALLYRHGEGFRVHVDATLIEHLGAWIEEAARLLPRER